ncbi:MAG: SIR2 family protein [Oscillospiraceae bacterium]|nr:SIR2 family protein [Oscillospiraceae bacterium]
MDKTKFEEGIKEPLERILLSLRKNNMILWAGSGLSLYMDNKDENKYPSVNDLCVKIFNSAKDEDKKELERYKASLPDISSEYCRLYKREMLIDILKDCFDTRPNFEPTTHNRIFEIKQIDTIITTNYDRLFEFAFSNKTNVIVGDAYKRLGKWMTDLYKIHGDTSIPDSIIITREDYDGFSKTQDKILWNIISALLASKSILFVGYSLEDKNVQDMLEKYMRLVSTTDNEFFIVTPKPLHNNTKIRLKEICNKITYIPRKGEELFEYIKTKSVMNQFMMLRTL